MSRTEHATTPWHRVPMVWLLIAFPLLSVVGGFTTLWLAVQSNDGLVVDDYYRRGKEINLELRRDRAAAARGLRAVVLFDKERAQARIELAGSASPRPAQLTVQLLHATRQGYDRRMRLAPGADGAYLAPLHALAPGHYYVEISTEDWRLLGSVRLPEDTSAEMHASIGASAY